jgi:hypothetical protein
MAAEASSAGSAGTSLRLLTAAGDTGLPAFIGVALTAFGKAAFGLALAALLLLLLALLTMEEPFTGLSLALAGALSTEATLEKTCVYCLS